MGLTKLIVDLDSHLRNEEKELEILRNLLLSNKISQSTFDLVEKKIKLKISLATNLKEALEAEEVYWQNRCLDVAQMLELLLIEFRHRFLLGEIGEDELTHKNAVISQGLMALTNKEVPKVSENTSGLKPAQPLQTTLEQQTLRTLHESITKQGIEEATVSYVVDREEKVAEPAEPKSISDDGQTNNKRRRPLNKEPPELDASTGSIMHCMNPWKPECRNTDIELSIYYKGRSTPICHKCWEDISDKNVEWSSL